MKAEAEAGGGEPSGGQLRPILECLLFVAAEPLSAAQVARLLEIEEKAAVEALETLRREFGCGGGLRVAWVAGGYQISTRPEYAEIITRFLQPDPQRLSRQAVETLAVIAYRQPITQPEIELLRGVDCSSVLKTLVDRGLIREAGRKEGPGRPILYATTPMFLKHFGLGDLSELPALEPRVVEEEESGRRAA